MIKGFGTFLPRAEWACLSVGANVVRQGHISQFLDVNGEIINCTMARR